jgi:glucokinase
MTQPSLVADIGGTNTRVALADGRHLRAGTIRRFTNAGFAGLEDVLRTYLDGVGVVCGAVCVAVAGPVADGVASMTNLDWTIDSATLTRATGVADVAILNDLQAQGHALGHIAAAHLRPVMGVAKPTGTQLVIGIGTGFNAAPVHHTAFGRIVAPSESGHVSMAVRTEADFALARHIEAAHGFAGVEDVLSGRGLERLFAFVTARTGPALDLPAADIMASLAQDSGPALETAQIFVRLLGAEAGNLALTHLPFGGIYLCGGVARAFAPYLDAMGFAAAFYDKGRFAGFMQDFAVSVIEDDYAALTGCAVALDARAAQT